MTMITSEQLNNVNEIVSGIAGRKLDDLSFRVPKMGTDFVKVEIAKIERILGEAASVVAYAPRDSKDNPNPDGYGVVLIHPMIEVNEFAKLSGAQLFFNDSFGRSLATFIRTKYDEVVSRGWESFYGIKFPSDDPNSWTEYLQGGLNDNAPEGLTQCLPEILASIILSKFKGDRNSAALASLLKPAISLQNAGVIGDVGGTEIVRQALEFWASLPDVTSNGEPREQGKAQYEYSHKIAALTEDGRKTTKTEKRTARFSEVKETWKEYMERVIFPAMEAGSTANVETDDDAEDTADDF